jgi:hypothetical protein
MMQGFYLLAMQQARRRTLLAALACLAAMISLVLAGRALLPTPAVPASAAISYTVQSENDRLVIRQSDGSVLRTGIDTRTLPSAEQHALADGITLDNAGAAAGKLQLVKHRLLFPHHTVYATGGKSFHASFARIRLYFFCFLYYAVSNDKHRQVGSERRTKYA